MTDVDLDDWRWLVGPEGAVRLAEAAAFDDPLALVERLRKSLSPARAALVAEQVVLRRKARAKFRRADEMFFTAGGLEQATDDVTAAYKASRFPPGTSLDACCGIGGDLAALALRGPAGGVDRDPVRSLAAEANVRVLASRDGAPASTVVLAEDLDVRHVADVDAWHVDPDRRPTGRRTTRLELHEPSLELLERLLAANSRAAVKLAPAAEPPADWTGRCEQEWISRAGECKQLVAWFGLPDTVAGARRATMLSAAGVVRTLIGSLDGPPPQVAEIGRYVFDCDAAVLAAGLVGTLAAELRLSALHAGSVYLTGDHLIKNDPAAACFKVRETLPFDVRQLRGLLAARGIGRLEIKKRGVEVDVEKLRRELKPRGDDEACLILARRGDRVTAVLAGRV